MEIENGQSPNLPISNFRYNSSMSFTPPENVQEILNNLPTRPGVYLHKDKNGTIIYVGKAVNLRSRVRSYFLKNVDSVKTHQLRKQITDIEIITTDTELEALLLSHPAVADVCVIGKPDGEAGELPKAFVVRRGAITAEALLDFVAARVAPYKKVRELEFIDAVPKSPTGKLLRRVLVERERERETAVVS